MHPTRRAPGAILCARLCAMLIPLTAQAQSNYLVPLPQKGMVIALNNTGQVLYDTGLLTGNTFVAFPAAFNASVGSPRTLSESGVVVGNTTTGEVAVYSAGTVTDLGQPPFVPPPPQGQSDAIPTAINASGQIVGYAAGPWFSFIYSSGVFNSININNSDLDGQPPAAVDINDSGQVVLSGPSRTTGCHGFLVTGAVLTDLGAQCPNAINASGQITGGTGNSSGQSQHAFIWANGTTTLAEPPPFTASYGDAINKGGQIVGRMSNTQSSAPFFYNGVMTDINSLISASDPLNSSVTIGWAIDINDSRLLLLLSTVPVVGSSTAYLLQAPWLDIAPGPLTFANQAVGTTSQPQTLTLTNSGTVPLSLDSISLASGAADFSQTNACPQSLAAGANCTVSVTVAPSMAGVQNAVLNVVTGGATITVPLASTTPITISLSATTTSPTVGQSFTITWTATPGSTCQSSGGTPNDGWQVTTASGSASVTEAAAGMVTYDMTCTAGSVSAKQSVKVTVANPPVSANPPASGGGGALDLGSLLLLGWLLVVYWQWRGIRIRGGSDRW
jgi:probable HAF family extracellular repeat protein